MKKVFIFLLLLTLFLPLNVFGATGYFWYETEPVEYIAYISNKNGAKALCYDMYEEESCGEIFIPYLSKIKASNEVFINGKLYVEFIYEEKEYYLSLNDIKIANGNYVDVAERSFKVLTYKDIYLYSGPAYAYDEVIKVPAGTELKINYSNTLWAYTEYNGKKGWVNFYSYESAEKPTDHSGCLEISKFEYYLNSDLKLVDSPFSNKVVGVIPKGKNIEFNHYFDGINGISFYIEYNGIKGWINKINDYVVGGTEIYDENGLEVMAIKGGSIFTLKELNIYSDVKKTSIIGKIPKYTDVSMNYPVSNKDGDKEYLNIKYNDIVGWVIDEDANEENENDCYKRYFSSEVFYDSYILLEDITIKNKITDEEVVIKKGEIVYTDVEIVEDGSIYYKDNIYEYVDFEGERYDAFYEESDISDDDKSDVEADNSEDIEDELKRFEFKVNVPTAVSNAEILGVDIFLEDMVVTKLDDNLSTLNDDFISTKQDDIKIGVGLFENVSYIYYVILGIIVVLVILIIVIKNKKKNVHVKEINNNIDEVNNMSLESNDTNETQL